jgi:oligoendopeptidase F
MSTTPPRWDLSNVYPGLESPEFEADKQQLVEKIEALENLSSSRITKAGPETPVEELASLVGETIVCFNDVYGVSATLRAYTFSFVSTDSRNDLARKQMSELERVNVRLENLGTQFQAWIGKLSPVLEEIIAADETAAAHAFMLRETAAQSRYMMSEAEESLASELNTAGANAWGRLQGTLTSQLSWDFELDGKVQKLPLPALINLHSHPDEDVRRRAYEAELEALGSVAEPLAACINGVVGANSILDKRRGREDAVHNSIDMARIDRPTLEAMLGAMEASFPTFRRYFQAKARRLGKDKLPWWDIWAPVGSLNKTYTYPEARQFIVNNFARFSQDLADFATRAFDNNWIDAEQRDGKRGGAFCMGVYKVQESRILSNFDGSLDQVSTIAHELGHGYHNHCMYRAGKTLLQSSTPMTMAETASIMCETVVMQDVLRETTDPQEELSILETMLIGDTQVIVDIYSRFIFEKELHERRANAELSKDEINDIMVRAQKATYGDGLDERYLHPYMWSWKPHYYRTGFNFYNFPYAFGLLFGIGLYAIYQQRGDAFIPDYQQLLASTGEANAADLAARFGIDIRQRGFWENSLGVIGERIERYVGI